MALVLLDSGTCFALPLCLLSFVNLLELDVCMLALCVMIGNFREHESVKWMSRLELQLLSLLSFLFVWVGFVNSGDNHSDTEEEEDDDDDSDGDDVDGNEPLCFVIDSSQ